MNNFKELAKLVKNRKENINLFYDLLDSEQWGEYFERLLTLSELKRDKTTLLAILRRLVDLKEENLIQEWKKNNFKEEKIPSHRLNLEIELLKFYCFFL